MGFKFRWLCELLQDLENNQINKVISVSRRSDPDRKVVKDWFDRHNAKIPRSGSEAVAFLSCLFPQRRVDRVYAIQELRLSLVLGRCLSLGTTRLAQLNQWRERGGMDLASCVQSVMQDSENPIVASPHEVTLEEIDDALEGIASGCQFSSADVRRKVNGSTDAHELLPNIVRRLRSWEAKWFVRLILKNFNPISLPETYTMLQYHFLLPAVLQAQSSFESAVLRLEEIARLAVPYRCLEEEVPTYMIMVSVQLAPKIGVFIERPIYRKARSIKHCCDLAALRRINVERKYDGEYCQIHVDASKGAQMIKIFSKSGKDSTEDRSGIHDILHHSLRLGQSDCVIKSRCILEGELLVWNELEGCIQPFYKIRRYVSRSGRFLGTNQDSRPDPHEHLMIMFYDLLLLDNDNYLHKPHNVRRMGLIELVRRLPGLADVGVREVIDFSVRRAAERLRLAFAESITDRWEGLVLKGCDDPYLPVPDLTGRSSVYSIKLKKDYIAGMGDTVDFAVVGGRYDAKDVHFLPQAGVNRVRWTSFHVACLDNKDSVKSFVEKPRFRVVDVLNHQNISKEDILELNRLGQFEELEFPSEEALNLYEIEIGLTNTPAMAQMFRKPFILEMTGAGFDRPPNANFRTLRFPRSSRLHLDRSFESATSFEELQAMAKAADSPPNRQTQEDREWIERLEKSGRKRQYIIDKSQSLSSRLSTDLESLQTRRGSSSATTSPSTLIRMDSSEILPNEYRSPEGHVRTRAESSLGTTSPKSKKRKVVPRDSPFEGRHRTKRVRPSPPVLQRCQQGSTCSSVNITLGRTSRLVKPLREIRNVSPSKTRHPLEPPLDSKGRDHQVTVEENAPAFEPAIADRAVEQVAVEVSHGLSLQTSRTITIDAALPTPPISSPEDVGAVSKDGKTLENQPSGRPATRPADSNASFDAGTSFSARSRGLERAVVYINERLSKTNPHHRFFELLRSASMSVTFSRKHFLQRLALPAYSASESKPAIGVVLVRAAEPHETAEEIIDTEREVHQMMKQQRNNPPQRDRTILFMDWRYLALFQDAPAPTSESEASAPAPAPAPAHGSSERRRRWRWRLEECFAGALKWRGDDDDLSVSETCDDISDEEVHGHSGPGGMNLGNAGATRRNEAHTHFEREGFWDELYALDGFTSQHG